MKRSKDYLRHQRERVIKRKLNILRKTWGSSEADSYYTDKRKGKLHKGKVHCSCGMCSIKSSEELKASDKRSLINAKEQIKELQKE